MSDSKDFFLIYFAGELFTHKDLLGNAMLAEAIYAHSNGKFRCSLPQNFEQRKSQPKKIRDEDILSLIDCDIALFNYDGQELDSGTVVEFMFAKFADIASLIVRSDFRGGGDCVGESQILPWNLMTSFYPRTKTLLLNSAQIYKDSIKDYYCEDGSTYTSAHSGTEFAKITIDKIAVKIVEALEELVRLKPTLTTDKVAAVYDWLATMPDFDDSGAAARIKNALARKIAKKLF